MRLVLLATLAARAAAGVSILADKTNTRVLRMTEVYMCEIRDAEFPRRNHTVQKCDAVCAATPKCVAFNHMDTVGKCSLKSCNDALRLREHRGLSTYVPGPPRFNQYELLPPGAISGCDSWKVRPRVVGLYGGAHVWTCETRCDQDRACRGFSYDRKSQTCYFKTCAPPRTDGDERFESYAKASTCVARAPPARVSKRAAVVVAVRDAADYAARCVEALWRSADARGPSRDALFIVNDASSAATLKRLGALVAARKRDAPLPATLVNWDGAATLDGYTRAANLGLEAARDAGPFDAYCFLNSDTEVLSPLWLETLKRHAFSDDAIGLVGPLSNAASYQSVPALRAVDAATGKTDWSKNPLPASADRKDPWTAEAVAAAVARASRRRLVDVPILNGFCLFVKAEVFAAVGAFDEEAFPHGFGEENDFALRAAAKGYALKVADDVYVWHHKSKSYGDATRKQLSAGSSKTMKARWGPKLRAAVVALDANEELADVRQRVASVLSHPCGPGRLRVLYVLNPTSEAVEGKAFQLHGGWISIFNEVIGLRRRGACAYVAAKRWMVPHFKKAFGEDLVRPYADDVWLPHELAAAVKEDAAAWDVIVATLFTTVEAVNAVAACHPATLPAYFIQDYEPNFKRLNKAQKQRALESYTLYPHMLAMAKTSWLRQTVFKHHGTKVRAVRGTLDLGKFEAARRRRPRRTPSKTIVAAMVRPATPRRNPAGTLRVLEGLRIARPSVDVRTFGSTPDALDELLEAEDLLNTTKARHRAAHLGPLDQDGIAKLFARSDVFLDLSLFQAFGRAGLEAMATGCVVVVPKNSGAEDYASDGANAVLVDATDEAGAIRALAALADDAQRRAALAARGLETVKLYALRPASKTTLEVLCAGLAGLPDRNDSMHRSCSENAFLDFTD